MRLGHGRHAMRLEPLLRRQQETIGRIAILLIVLSAIIYDLGPVGSWTASGLAIVAGLLGVAAYFGGLGKEPAEEEKVRVVPAPSAYKAQSPTQIALGGECRVRKRPVVFHTYVSEL